MLLNFDYAASEAYTKQIGLHWLPNEYLVNADREAKELGMTQEQVDAAMRHHIWHVKQLFDPRNYTFAQRVALARRFILGG